MTTAAVATRSGSPSPVAQQRQALIKDLESKNASLNSLQEELGSAKGAERAHLASKVKQEAASFQASLKTLDLLEQGIVLPHLQLSGLTIWFHPDGTQFNATVWVNNNSILPALGSFELDLSAGFYTYEQDPPLYVNETFPTITPDSTDVQPGGANPFFFSNIPFVTKPGTASALYTFDVLLFAGPEGVVADQNLHQQFLLRRPIFPRPVLPVGPARL
jgi:hypothetical protein